MSMLGVQIDHHLATYLARVAAALEAVPKCDPGYGEFYVSQAVVSFDGEETQFSVVADEHGGYAVAVKDIPTTPASGEGEVGRDE